MTTESATTLAAARAWRAAFEAAPPMPPGVALDMVQDECGDRYDACLELIAAAAAHLEVAIPDSGNSLNTLPLHEQATLAVGHFWCAGWGMVRTRETLIRAWAGRIREAVDYWPADGTPTSVEFEVALRFEKWARLLDRAVKLCRAIEEAV